MIKSPGAKVHWYFNISMTVAYFGFVLIKAAQVFLDPCKSVGEKLYMVVATVVYAPPPVFAFNIASTNGDFTAFIKGYIRFLQERERFQAERRDSGKIQEQVEVAVGEGILRLCKQCKWLMIVFNWMAQTAPIAIAVLNIAHPTSPEMPSSLLNMDEGDWFWRSCGIMASTAFETYFWMCYAHIRDGAREDCPRASPARGLPAGICRAGQQNSGTGRAAGARSIHGPVTGAREIPGEATHAAFILWRS